MTQGKSRLMRVAAGRRGVHALVALCGLSLASGVAQAGHGFGAIGFGAESIGLASADVALARDSGALNTNPAGLTQVAKGAWDLYINPYDLGGIKVSDEFGNDEYQIDNPYGAIIGGSYAWRMESRPDVVLATGLFAQGGAGFVYENLATAFGTRDELSLIFSVFKAAVGFGWSVTPKLSVGANVGVSYAQGRQKFFPHTSNAEAEFFGLRFDGGQAVKPSLGLGIQFKPTSTLTLSAAYASEIAIDLKGGNATVNYEALGVGNVVYQDAEIRGFALPQELSLGLSWRFHPDLLLAVETKWYNWAASINSTTLSGRNPNREGLSPAQQSLNLSTRLDWDDQYVLGLGLEWNYSNITRLRVGLDLPSDPVPHENLSPLLNLVQKEQITAGLARDLGHGWLFEFAAQYQFPHEIRYINPNLPFGTDTRLDYGVMGLAFSLGRRW